MASASKAQNGKRYGEVLDEISDLKKQLKSYMKGGIITTKGIEEYLEGKTELSTPVITVIENTRNIVDNLAKLVKKEERKRELETLLAQQENKNIVYQDRKLKRRQLVEQLHYNLRSSPSSSGNSFEQELLAQNPKQVKMDLEEGNLA